MEKELLSVRKRDYQIKKIISFSGDFLVPDTKPDIINSIGINGFLCIRKEETDLKKIRLEGVWDGDIIYLSDIGEIKSLNHKIEFVENFENEKIEEKDDIEYDYKIIKKEVKILNERKVNASIEIEFFITGYKCEEIEMISEFDNMEKLEKLEEKVLVKKFVNKSYAKSSINEDINFSENVKNIEILKKDMFVSNIEKKISYNKILAKAEANISILYQSENQTKKYNTKIPIMSFIEMENVKEEYIIDLNYKVSKFVLTNNVMEKNSINCDLEFEISCNMYEKKEIVVVKDLYSLEKELEFSKKMVNIECITQKDNEIFKYSEKINVENIKEIYDFEYSLKSITKSDSKNSEGILNLNLYYSKEENNSLLIKSVDIPFIMNNISEEKMYKIKYCNVKSNNNEYICDFELECMENLKLEEIDLINDCKILENNCNDEYSMIIYFVKKGDTIWNIAKKFKISMESIIKINNLENPDKIYPGDKLYIMKG